MFFDALNDVNNEQVNGIYNYLKEEYNNSDKYMGSIYSNTLLNPIIGLSQLNENNHRESPLIPYELYSNNENIGNLYHPHFVGVYRGFGRYENEIINDPNESSFFSFDHNDNTILGSTQSSIHDSSINFNSLSLNISLNDDLNSEEKNSSQELIICFGEKIEDKK